LEALHAAVYQILLRREIVEHGRFRHLRRLGDLSDADTLEATRGEQPPGRALQQQPGLLLLPLPQASLDAHAGILA
jgi:hypothetical protein